MFCLDTAQEPNTLPVGKDPIFILIKGHVTIDLLEGIVRLTAKGIIRMICMDCGQIQYCICKVKAKYKI